MKKDLRVIINSYFEDLSPSEKKVANFILEDPTTASKLSIQGLSTLIDTSTATVSRFAKHVGYPSYQALKVALLTTLNTTTDHPITELEVTDNSLTLVQKVFAANIRSLEDTLRFINQEDLDKAIVLFNQSDRVAFFGIGGSQIVAQDAFHKFLRTGLNALYQSDFHMQLMTAAKLTNKDCGVIISHTGRNEDTIRIVEILKENNVPLIVITSHAGSPIVDRADVSFISVSEEINYRSEAVSATLSQISLVDCLYTLYNIGHIDEYQKVNKKIRKTIDRSRR